jgi:uncharacterized alkaline shock family protein YloU
MGRDDELARVLDKLLLFIYSLIILAASIAFLAASAGVIAEDSALDFVREELYGGWGVRTAVIIVSAVMLLISLRFLYVALRRGGGAAPSIDQRTEFGDIRISLETVENLALKAASRHRGVQDLRARIRVTDAGIDISVRAVVDGDSPIPALSEEIQRSVRDHVEEITGIPVANVAVYIANIVRTQTFKNRVE